MKSIFEVLKDEALDMPLEGNLEDPANDQRQTEEILVRLQRHKRRNQSVYIIDKIENDLANEPQGCNHDIKDAPLVTQPLSNLPRDNHPLNRRCLSFTSFAAR